MLPRSQVRALLDEGRALVNSLAECLHQYSEFQNKEREAFSLGVEEGLLRIDVDKKVFEADIRSRRENLANLLRQLRTHTEECVEEYKSELKLAGAHAKMHLPPDPPVQFRLEDYGPYFDKVEEAVNLTTERLLELRQKELHTVLSEVRDRLTDLHGYGESLPAVEEYLQKTTYLDLPLAAAADRLRDEVELIGRRIQECERKRREEEDARRLLEAKTALANLSSSGETELESADADLQRAMMLCSVPDAAERKHFWEVCSRLLRLGPPHLRDPLLVRGQELVQDSLSPQTEDDPLEFLSEVGTALPFLDRLLTEHRSDNLQRLAENVLAGVHPPLAVSRLCRLKALLPSTSFALFRDLARVLPISTATVATWFLALPTSFDQPGPVEWIGSLFESEGLWREAFASWSVVGDGDNGHAALLISVANSPDLAPDSAETWWEVVSRNSESYGGGYLTAVAAVTSYIVGTRAGLATVCQTAGDLTDSLVTHPALKAVLSAAVRALPMSLKQELSKRDANRHRVAALRKDLDAALKIVRRGLGGTASYNFNRDCLLPELNRLYRDKGASGLVGLGEELVTDLYRREGFQINSAVTAQFVAHLVELGDKASALAEAEESVRKSPVPASAELLMALRQEEKIEANNKPALKWLYQRGHDFIADDLHGPDALRIFTVECLYAELFRGNPLVDLGKPSKGADLFEPVIQALVNDSVYDSWRVQRAIEARNFARADAYCASASVKDQARLKSEINAAKALFQADLRERVHFIRDFLDTLDRDTKVDDLGAFLVELLTEIEHGDLATADNLLQTAYRTYDELERTQRQSRESAIEAARIGLDRAFERLCQRRERGGELYGLAAALIVNTNSPAELLRRYGEAIHNVLNDRDFDRSLLTVGAILSTEPPRLPDSMSVAIPELPPIELSSLSSLVRADLELRAKDTVQAAMDLRRAEEVLRTGTGATDRITAAFNLYAVRHPEGDAWEEPLTIYLEEKGHQSFEKHDYLRAEEFYLAAAQVSYRASSRLSGGLSALRRTAFNHAFAHLQRLRFSYGSTDSDARPVESSTPRDWVSLMQGYLLLRAPTDLAHVLGMLAGAAPTVMPEFLELPLCEVVPLRLSLLQTLLDTLGTPKPGDTELLELIATYRMAKEVRLEIRTSLRQLREVATILAETPHLARTDRVSSSLGDLSTRFEGMGIPDDMRQLLLGYIERLKGLASVTADPSKTEAIVSAITREVFLDGLDEKRAVPLHLRVSISPESAFLRDVEIAFRCDHPEMELVDSDKVVRLLRLEGDKKKEPVELAVHVRRRKSPLVSTVVSSGEPVPLSLEIAEIGVRQGGLLRGGVPFKGRKQSINVRRTYPHSEHPNPYSVGTAVRNFVMIKGRDDETREIFRTLHGQYQDNVPLIWGARRIGKSTLLYRIKLDPEVRRYYEPVICDIEYVIRDRTSDTPSFLAALAGNISQELTGTPAGRVPIPEIRNASDCMAGFRSYLDNLAAACEQRSLLLMFDEMDFFFDRMRQDKAAGKVSYSQGLHEDIIHTLRHYMQHKKGVSFLLSGTKSLLEMSGNVSERLFHMPLPIKVTELNAKAAEALLTEPIGDIFSYSASARDRMLFLTNNHPYFLQGICYEVFRLMQDQHLSVCSIAELNQAIQQRVMNQTPTFSFQYDELRMSSEKKLVGRAVAELTQEDRRTDLDAIVSRIELVEGRSFAVALVEQALMSLTGSEILMRSGRGYRFRVPLMAIYVNTRNREVAA